MLGNTAWIVNHSVCIVITPICIKKEIDANEWHYGQDGSEFSENVHFSFERVFENNLGCHICI